MLWYRDRTWCAHYCGNEECDRNFTDEERERAIKWWGDENVPIAFSNFKTKDCGYIKKND